jgi:hypothetical protein
MKVLTARPLAARAARDTSAGVLIAESTVLERDYLVCKTFFLESADEALLDGDAAMPANCAEPGANVVVVAPIEVVLAELAALIADGVLRCASSTPGRLVKYKADLGARGTPLKNSKAERAARPVVNDDCNPLACLGQDLGNGTENGEVGMAGGQSMGQLLSKDSGAREWKHATRSAAATP